ncbi:MAG: vWA domain-containing protein [bacterium]
MLLFGYGLDLRGNSLLYLLLTCLALVAALFVYRRTLPPVSVAWRGILSALRVLALAIILLLLFEPVLHIFLRRTEKPSVLVLVDKSASMSIQDAEGPRPQTIQRLLSGSGLESLRKRTRLHYFAFSDSAQPLAPEQLDTLPATGSQTNLSAAWERAEATLADESAAAILIFSDGANNSGPNPVRMAGLSSIPMYTIGLGDTTARQDAVLSQILANDVTYLNSRVPVDVRVQATGLDGKVSRLRLLDRNGTELASQELRFSGSASEVTATLTFTATQVGDRRYTILLDSIPGEWTTANNRRSLVIRVLETRSKVILLSGPPTPSLSALRHTLQLDSNLAVRAFIESSRGGYLLDSAPTREELSTASLLVLVNFPSARTADNLLSDIAEVVSSRRIPVMFFSGPALHRENLAKLAPILPCQLQRSSPSEGQVTLREVTAHPALTGNAPLPISWSELPPVFGGKDNFVLGPIAQVAVMQSRATLGIPEDEPAIALWTGGGRKGIAFLIWGTYRWKLGLATNKQGAAFHDELLSRLTRWLVSPLEEKPVRIAPNKSLFSGGERVLFQAQVYGADLSARDDAAVMLTVTMAQRSETLPLQGRGHGRYEAAFLPWGEGDYSFRGFAQAGADTLGKDAGTFAVEAFSIEMLDTRQRPDILRGIAEASGGRYAPNGAADTMLAALDFPLREVQRHREIPLWNRALMLWVVIGALGLEWLIRKRRGML